MLAKKTPEPGTEMPHRASDAVTVIGENIAVEGNISGEADLAINGTVKGKIELKGNRLVVGPRGHVDADIVAGRVTVSGRLTGNITAQERVKITKEALFEGEIRTKSISIEDGAALKATIDIQREPALKSMEPVPVIAEGK